VQTPETLSLEEEEVEEISFFFVSASQGELSDSNLVTVELNKNF